LLLNQFFSPKKLFEGGNLASHTATGDPTVGWTGVPGNYSAGKIDSKNRAAMQPAVKQLLVDINNLFTRQYGRPIWNPELIEKEVETFISGSSKWFMMLRQPNPRFNPQVPVSDANPKEIGVTDKDFQRVKKKVGDIDTQIDRTLEPQIEEFIHKNVGVNIGSATLLGTKKGSDQWLALWQVHEPPITLQVDLEFSDYTKDERGFEIPTEWAQVSHGSAWEDLEAGMKGVFRQWLYRSLAKVAPTEKYIAKVAGAGKNKGMKLFGGDDGKELIVDLDNPPPPLHDANFSFAVASVGGGGVRAKYRQPTAQENVPLEINGIPVMIPLSTADSQYIKDMSQQFEQFFGTPATGNETKMMASFVGSVELMKQYFTPEQQQIAVQEFLKINFGNGAQMIDADDPTSDFTTKMTAIDYLLDQTGMKNMRKQVLQMAKDYENAYHAKKAVKATSESLNEDAMMGKIEQTGKIVRILKKQHSVPFSDEKNWLLVDTDPAKGNKGLGLKWVPASTRFEWVRPYKDSLAEAEVQAQFRKNMPHLRDLKPLDFLDLLDEIHDGNGNFKLENIPLNVKVDGFGGRFGKSADGRPFMGTSNTPPRYEAGFVKHHQTKGTTDPEILGRAQLFDELFNEMMNAVELVDSQLGPEFLLDKQVTCEVLFIPFATETPDGRLKFVGISYDKLPEGVNLALVPFRVVSATTGEDLPDAQKIVKQLTSLGQQDSVMFLDNSLTQKEGLDVTAIVPPLENIENFKAMLADNGKGVLERKREVAAALEPVKLALEKAIIEDPNILGKDLLGKDYEGIVINSRLGPIKVTSAEQKKVIADKNAAKAAVKVSQANAQNIPQTENKTAVVAIGSFVGHIGHEQLFDYTIKKAESVQGDPYLFIGNAQGKDDPIPPNIKVQTWHKMYPTFAKQISTVTDQGGTLMQKIKHELIQPRPGQPPRYDNITIMVGEDQAGMNIAQALMKAVNKFKGYEHVKVSLEATPRGTGMSFSKLRNILKDPNATEEQQLSLWTQGFDVNKLGVDWIKHLMDVTRKGMGIQKQPQRPAPQPAPVAERLFNALTKPAYISELDTKKTWADYGILDAETEKKKKEQVYHGWQDYEDEKSTKDDEKETDTDETMSAGVRMQRALQREKEKSDYSRRYAEKHFPIGKKPEPIKEPQKEQGVAEGKVKLYTDPSYFGAEVDDTGFDSLAIVDIPANQLVGFEPDAKMNQPKSRANVEKIVAGLKQGAKLPPLLVRKYKNGYQVLDGHHRFWAYKLLGVKSIPAQIVPAEDVEEIGQQGVAESADKSTATRRIQKMLNDKYKANLDVDGVLGPLTLKSINKFIPNARAELADQPNKTTAVQGKKNKDQSVSEITNKDAIKQYKDIQNYKHVDRPKQDEKEFLRISVNRSKKQSTVAEGSSGAKYKVRSIGQDKKGEYYISPSTGEKVYKKAKVGDHEVPGSKEIKPKLESMLPKTAFAGSDKNKLGPAAHLKGSMKRPARQGDLVGSAAECVETEDQRLDPKCWKGYRKAGTKMKGGTRVNNCVPVREDIEDLMAGYIRLLEKK